MLIAFTDLWHRGVGLGVDPEAPVIFFLNDQYDKKQFIELKGYNLTMPASEKFLIQKAQNCHFINQINFLIIFHFCEI